MRFIIKLLPVLLLTLTITSIARAEQIKLVDGRFLQGDVKEIDDNGFKFRLTETGGEVYLRWNQVDSGLKKRLLNETDPDEGLDLTVVVNGSRLETLDGRVFIGDITETDQGYRVVNLKNKRGVVVPHDEVAPDGLIQDVEIDARNVLEDDEVLKLAEENRAPVETARQYYELARIADKLSFFPEAKDYVTLALAADPDEKLEAVLTEYQTKLEDLIRQSQILDVIKDARALAKKDVFFQALKLMNDKKEEYQPTGSVLEKFDEAYNDLDLEYSEFVIDQWYSSMKKVASAKAREKELSVQEAFSWTRRQMTDDILNDIAGIVGVETQTDGVGMVTFDSSGVTDIRARFDKRFELEYQKLVKLRKHKADFTKDGFYSVVGGHLPAAGKRPQADRSDDRSKKDGRARNRDADGRRIGPRENRSVAPPTEKEIEDFLKALGDADSDGLQDAPKLPPGISEDDVKDILRKVREGLKKMENEDGGNGKVGTAGGQDISHLKVPDVVPSLVDWWEDEGRSTKTKWLIAAYVKFSGTMQILEYKDWKITYK